MKLIFSLTCGRTGTAFLASLLESNLQGARVCHEILSYGSFGLDTPDISHLQAFNVHGNTAEVKEFWRRKLQRIEAWDGPVYAETSHVLMKAGLVENLAELARAHEVHFVILERDILRTLVSYRNRSDFTNYGNMWMWYLDPGYPRNMVDARSFLDHGVLGIRLWYICEIRWRSAFYKHEFSRLPNFHFHRFDIATLNDPAKAHELLQLLGASIRANEVAIPGKQNETKSEPVPQTEIARLRDAIETLAGPVLAELSKRYENSDRVMLRA
jgi:hypothetical protein